MERIYFDNGSTSFPKAPGVSDAVRALLEGGAFNINRGGYEEAYAISGQVLETRQMLCSLFGFPKFKNVVFTPSITYSLNYLIKGFLKPGDHVITSSMEHNAVMRPLVQMEKQGVAFDAVPCAGDGTLDPALVEKCANSGEFTLALLVGMLVSFLFGIIALKWLMNFVQKGKFHVFAYYLWTVGILGLFFIG